MSVLDNIARALGYEPRKAPQPVRQRGYYVKMPAKRNFSGTSTERLYASWNPQNYSADSEIRGDLKTLRARSRELERNNDYAKKFFRMVKTNVVGASGIKLQSMVMFERGQKPDDGARARIESAFLNWQKRGNCDVTGAYAFRDVQKLVVSSVARDGEALVRIVRGYDNPFRFALQLIEADHLDEHYSDMLPSGNIVKMGIEFDKWGKPVAYHIFERHPGDMFGMNVGNTRGERIRIPAADMLHVFHPMRVSQSRGVPWMHAAMTRLNMLGGYEEAELVAARLGANKGGFYKQETGEEYVGDDIESGTFTPLQNSEPGEFEVLGPGWDFKPYDPQHPNSAFEAFEKAILRGIASGLDVSYNYLANDLEGVNYSSMRAGVIDERDVWRDIQAFIIDHFLTPVFENWLEMALLSGQISLPFTGLERFKVAKWQARGWQWVDPLKDLQAKRLAITGGLDTAASIAAETGKDIEEIYAELAREKELRKKHGIQTDLDTETQPQRTEAIADEEQ